MLFFFELFLAVCFAFFLSVLASFFNVVIFRTARGESFIKGRSKCEFCHKQIAWYDNIPLLSFLMLRGRCRNCHKKIAPIYFLTELFAFLIGFIFILGIIYLPYLQNFSLWQLVLYFLIFFVLSFALLADLQYLIVPDFFVGLLLILVLATHFLMKQNWLMPIFAVFFSSAFFIGLYLIAKKILKKEALGLGDIKLMIPLAFLLSWPKILVNIFLAFIIGGFFAMLMLITGRKKVGQALPFAPFLILSALISFLFGELIWQWYFGFLF